MLHDRHADLRHVQGATQVDVHDRVIVASFDLERLQRLGDASVVDQNVDAAPFGGQRVNSRLACVLVDDVARQTNVLLADVGCCCLGCVFVQVQDRNGCAVLGE